MAAAGVPVRKAHYLRERVAVFTLFGTAVALVLAERAYRAFEVHLTGIVLRWLTSRAVHVAGAQETVHLHLASGQRFGLRMAPEVSSVFMILPLVLLTTIMLWLRPRNTRRLLCALAIASVALISLSQAHVLAIVGLADWLGQDSDHWAHTLLGSLMKLFGGAATLVLFVWLSTRGPRRERAGS
ncbi:exosortase/archaeosortase family protein [Amycolatopsis anabasis]|uniref:exosortase/archaeosortase family protein n=1 Tax=Amycolatopsis anabasis TaxID=1840409 RepID=UPI001FE9C7E6|nr:exosortase/archaeosortase family protein [Amycolatopsis anabasis]